MFPETLISCPQEARIIIDINDNIPLMNGRFDGRRACRSDDPKDEVIFINYQKFE